MADVVEHVVKWSYDFEKNDEHMVWPVSALFRALSVSGKQKIVSDNLQTILGLLPSCTQKVILEDLIIMEKDNFRIDTNWWEKTELKSWEKVRINENWDVWELMEWDFEWQQFFTWEASLRETSKYGKRVFNIKRVKEIIQGMGWIDGFQDYEKFKKDYNLQFCGYISEHWTLVSEWNECKYWTTEMIDDEWKMISEWEECKYSTSEISENNNTGEPKNNKWVLRFNYNWRHINWFDDKFGFSVRCCKCGNNEQI